MIPDECAGRRVKAADPLHRDLEGLVGRKTEPEEIPRLATQAIFEDIHLRCRKRSVPFHVGPPPGDRVFNEVFVQDPGPLVMKVPEIGETP